MPLQMRSTALLLCFSSALARQIFNPLAVPHKKRTARMEVQELEPANGILGMVSVSSKSRPMGGDPMEGLSDTDIAEVMDKKFNAKASCKGAADYSACVANLNCGWCTSTVESDPTGGLCVDGNYLAPFSDDIYCPMYITNQRYDAYSVEDCFKPGANPNPYWPLEKLNKLSLAATKYLFPPPEKVAKPGHEWIPAFTKEGHVIYFELPIGSKPIDLTNPAALANLLRMCLPCLSMLPPHLQLAALLLAFPPPKEPAEPGMKWMPVCCPLKYIQVPASCSYPVPKCDVGHILNDACKCIELPVECKWENQKRTKNNKCKEILREPLQVAKIPKTSILFGMQTDWDRTLFVKDATEFKPGMWVLIANATGDEEYNLISDSVQEGDPPHGQGKITFKNYMKKQHQYATELVQVNDTDVPKTNITKFSSAMYPPDASDLQQYDSNLSPCGVPGVPDEICLDWKKRWCGPDFIHQLFNETGHVSNPALFACMDGAWGTLDNYPPKPIKRPCIGLECLKHPLDTVIPYSHDGVWSKFPIV